MAGDGAGVTHWGHQGDPSPRESQVLRQKEEVRDKGRKERSRPREGRECEGAQGAPWSLGEGGLQEGPCGGDTRAPPRRLPTLGWLWH